MRKTFEAGEQLWQRSYLDRPEFSGRTGFHDKTWQFLPDDAHWNLAPDIRDAAKALFDHEDSRQRIQWHRYAGHGCSSQACCVNFLMPLAQDPPTLAEWVDYVTGTSGARIEPIEHRNGAEQLIAFEWVPDIDYLNEGDKLGNLSRGANSTSLDAAIRYRLGNETRLLLIEWKYTESYGNTRSKQERSGDGTRKSRYANIWKRPHGPMRADIRSSGLELEDLFLNPWYQLLRQQMLAYHVENDPLGDYDHVQLLHLSPAKNLALQRVNGAKFLPLAETIGPDATLFDVFTGLIDPAFRDRFTSKTIEWAFAPFDTSAPPEWIVWLRDRYPSLFPLSATTPGALE